MSKINKKNIAAAVLTVGLAAAGIGAVYADSELNGGRNPMSGLVTAIAQKFNLNENDVQKVFDEQKAKMDAERQAKMAEMEAKRDQEFKDRLAKAVSDGKLTQEQADKIIAKKMELETQRKSLEGRTQDEQREAMKTERDSLKQWIKDNNIPDEYMMFGGPGMGGRRHGFGAGEPMPPQDQQSQSVDQNSATSTN